MNQHSQQPIIVWFRRDLRISDNAALYHATLRGQPIIPLFIFDTDIINSLSSDGAAFNFQAECLHDLDEGLQRIGGRLFCRKGKVLQVHSKLIQEVSPSAIFYNRDYEPDARNRDRAVEQLYRSHGIEVQSFKDHVIHEPEEVLTLQNRPYSIFTPYMKAWKNLPVQSPFPTPTKIAVAPVESCGILNAHDLRKQVTIPRPLCRGGETQAKKVWEQFIRTSLASYSGNRNIPSIKGTSRLSPYIRFGCIAVRTLYRDLLALKNIPIKAFLNELIWREFYQSVMYHFPDVLTASYKRAFDTLPWNTDTEFLHRWRSGHTGVPLVDAGMRELNQTGWLHNRVRMVVASFLTKQLFIHWKQGEEYFESKLLDIETASNNGGWQWAASTGVDPKPLRIFNPELQAQKFDPEGVYIKTYVPELQNVPLRHLFAPHRMSLEEQHRCGCIIGKTYPRPIVDHRLASEKFKKAYMQLLR